MRRAPRHKLGDRDLRAERHKHASDLSAEHALQCGHRLQLRRVHASFVLLSFAVSSTSARHSLILTRPLEAEACVCDGCVGRHEEAPAGGGRPHVSRAEATLSTLAAFRGGDVWSEP